MRIFLAIGLTFIIVALTVMMPQYVEVHHVYLPAMSREGTYFYGVFVYGWERSALAHCYRNEWPWWVWGGPAYAELQDRYYEVTGGADYEPVYVELRGELSNVGHWGHLGWYSRQLRVTEVLTVAAEPTDMRAVCESPIGTAEQFPSWELLREEFSLEGGEERGGQ